MPGLIRYNPSHRRRWGSGNGTESRYRGGGPLHDKGPSTILDVVLLRSHNDWHGQIAHCIGDGSRSFAHRWGSGDRRVIICLPLGILTPSEEQNLFTFRRDPLDLQHWPACRTAFQEPYCLRGHVHAEAPRNKNKQQWKDSSLFGGDVKDPISVCCEVLHTTLFFPYPAECTSTSEHLLKAREQTRANPVLLHWLKGSHEASGSQCHPTDCPSCQQNSWAGVLSDLWRAVIQNIYLAKARDLRVEQCSDGLQIARSSLCC